MFRKVLLLLTITILISCSDNLYDKISDDSSKASMDDRLEVALSDKDYEFIKNHLEGRMNETLSLREVYLLQMAYMGLAGFDLLDRVDDFFDDDKNAVQIFMVAQSGGDLMSKADLIHKRAYYFKAMNLNKTARVDKDVLFASGVSAAMDTLLLSAEVILEMSASEFVSFNKNSPYYTGTLMTGKSESDLINKIDNIIVDMTDFNNVVVKAMEDGVNSLTGGSTKEKLENMIGELKDYGSDVTSMSLAQFIFNNFN